MLKVTTTGNATLIAYDGKPVIVTDPWFGDEEPAYFGSWVLSHRIPAQIKEDIACCQAGIEALLAHLGKTADFSKWDNWRPPSPTA